MIAGRGPLRVVAAAVVIGTVARLVLAFADDYINNDIVTWQMAASAFRSDPLHFYTLVPPERWPYSSGYMPWTALAQITSENTGLPFSGVVKLLPIACDGALALLVAGELRRSGSEHAAAAGCLIALGPLLLIDSARHGQLDSVAILPAVLALIVWRREIGARAVWAGCLLGFAASVKSPAGLPLLALLLNAKDRREAALLVVATASVILGLIAPFLLTTPHEVIEALTGGDVFGVGGITLVFVTFGLTDLNELLIAHQSLVVVLGLSATLIWSWRSNLRSAASLTAVLWLVFYVIAPSFFFGYLVWGLPFFLLAEQLRPAMALAAAITFPQVMFEWEFIDEAPDLYKAVMTVIWFALLAALVRVVTSGGSDSPPPRAAVRAPAAT